MRDPRARVTTDPGIGPLDPAETSATLCALAPIAPIAPADDAAEPSSGAPDTAKPRLLLVPEDDRELATVVISGENDPRTLETQLSLPAPPRLPVSDSGWPQAEVVLMTSQRPPPMLPPRHWRTPALLFALTGVLLLVALARLVSDRAAAQRTALGAAQPAVGASLSSPRVRAMVSRPAPVPVQAPGTVASASSLPVNAALLVPSSSPMRVAAPHLGSAKPNLPNLVHDVAAEALPSAPDPEKPKRAIY